MSDKLIYTRQASTFHIMPDKAENTDLKQKYYGKVRNYLAKNISFKSFLFISLVHFKVYKTKRIQEV